MASLINKISGAIAPLKKGAVVDTGLKLKEDDPHQGTVSLDKVPGKIIIVGVPGAFTPPCSSHVPGYVQNEDKFLAKGVKDIYVVAVNDAFCTKAWKKELGAEGSKVHFLADDTGAFTTKVGMIFDASGLLGNARAQRYVAVVEDGKVTHFEVEDEAPTVEKTKAENILAQL